MSSTDTTLLKNNSTCILKSKQQVGNFAEMLHEANDQVDEQTSAKEVLADMSAEELGLLQQATCLAAPIRVDSLSDEGAANLLAQELLTYTSPGGAVRVPVTVSVDTRGRQFEKETARDLRVLKWDRQKSFSSSILDRHSPAFQISTKALHPNKALLLKKQKLQSLLLCLIIKFTSFLFLCQW